MDEPEPEPDSFLPLHPLAARILLVLTEGPLHGYHVVKLIEERDGSWTNIFPANLYRRIRDLDSLGLIEEVDPPPDHASGSRKYFGLTELGLAVARAEARRLMALAADFRDGGLVEPADADG